LQAPILTMMLLDGHSVRMGSSQLAGHIKRSATRKVADTRVHGKISGGLQHQQKLNALLGWSLERHA